MTSSCLAGINLPTILGAYNHDLAPNERYLDWGCDFQPIWLFRYLAICHDLGFEAVRLWLCEDGEGIVTDEHGGAAGVMPELLRAIRIAQEGARMLDLRLYWSLLDGNAWDRNGHELTGRIFSEIEVARRFAERVAAPIAKALDPDVTFALEIVNEPESLSDEVLGGSGIPWPKIARSIRLIRDALRSSCPDIPITAGSQAVFLPKFFGSADEPAVDAVDLHVYHPDGGLPSRDDLPFDIGELPLLAGECGLSHRGEPDRSEYLTHYLYNGRKLDYRAVFLWKLEGERHLCQRRPIPESPESQRFIRTALGDEIRALLWNDWGEAPRP
jgi:hypothetical protein